MPLITWMQQLAPIVYDYCRKHNISVENLPENIGIDELSWGVWFQVWLQGGGNEDAKSLIGLLEAKAKEIGFKGEITVFPHGEDWFVECEEVTL